MKLDANLEIVNHLAASRGFKNGASQKACFSQLLLSKDPKSEKYYLLVKNTKNPTTDKYRLLGNVNTIHNRFMGEGKATITFKEPNFSLIINKTDPNKLRSFIKMVQLASTSENFAEEVNKLQQQLSANPASASANGSDLNSQALKELAQPTAPSQLKKPTTTLVIKSKKEYLSNFRLFIANNFKVIMGIHKIGEAALTLTRLTINSCDLRRMDPCLLKLANLQQLDLSNNKLATFDNVDYAHLQQLNLSNNELAFMGDSIHLPKLVAVDLSNNKLRGLTKKFCLSFKSVNTLRLNNNQLCYISDRIGYSMLCLKNFYANNNMMTSLPFSFSYLRLDMLELNNNPFEYVENVSDLRLLPRIFPSMVELCARKVVNQKIKYKPRDIPKTLDEYLNAHSTCICGTACFEYKFNMTAIYDINRISQSFTYLNKNGFDNQVPLKVSICSLKCYKKNCHLKGLW